MLHDPETRAVVDFVQKVQNYHVESTGASVVNYAAGLYNVDGSTYDPKHVPNHNGVAWKNLLIAYGINANCYVTNANPGGSHPNFSVGGHMTPNQNGGVATGGTCYLMPLCSWHNSTSKNGILFTHTSTSMLQLTGYMQGELAVTFQLRLPSTEPFALLYRKGDVWSYKDLSALEARNLNSQLATLGSDYHVLIERVHGEKTLHCVRSHNLPI